MKIYILSFYAVDCDKYIILGVYSSEENALIEMKKRFDDDEYITRDRSWPDDTKIYTNKETYRIEVYPLDDEVSES